MEDEVLVKVEGLSKKFCKSLKKSLKYGMYDLVSNLSGTASSEELRPDEFWALKDINFELKRGECLGLIGHNGAGKSTLLKILNGLINPDHGKVTMRGRVGALIELGAGFNPIMTGRENIYNNGAVLGFTRKEIDGKVEEIISFSELGEFMDMPVRNYSSGMKVRLGFAVAAQMEPDVLIIDEVLAVGDLGFIMKCFRTIDKLLSNTAIIYVSHNMPTVSRMCTKVILLEKGIEFYNGLDVGKALDFYYKSFSSNETQVVYTNNTIELISAGIGKNKNDPDEVIELNWKDSLELFLKFKIKEDIEIPLFRILIYDKEQRPLGILEPNYNSSLITEKNKILEFKVVHNNLQLSKGMYSINISVFKRNSNEPILRVNEALSFQVIHEEDHYQPFLLSCGYSDSN